MTTPGPWARYHAGWWQDPKVLRLSPAAELLFARAVAYTVQQLTDGTVTRHALAELAPKLGDPAPLAAELVKAKLWRRAGRNAWTFPPETWRYWQVTRAEVEGKRAAATDRTRRWRERQAAASVTRHEDPQPAPRNALRDASRTDPPYLPSSEATTAADSAERARQNDESLRMISNGLAARLSRPVEDR